MILNKNKNMSSQTVKAKKPETGRTSKQATELARKPLTGAQAVSTKAVTAAKKGKPEAGVRATKAKQVVSPAPAAKASKAPAASPAPAKASVVRVVAAKPVEAKPVPAKPMPTKPEAAKNEIRRVQASVGVAAERPVAPKVAEARSPARPVEAIRPHVQPAAVADSRKPEAKNPEAKKPEVKKPVEAPKLDAKKPTNQRQGFKTHEHVVYPAHGVGQIVAIEEQEVAGYRLELFVINFAKDKMTLRVPTTKVASVGMRKLAEPAVVQRSLETLQGRARVKRTMWSRRAQEYEAKINSGDIVAIAEVVRDLFRSDSQPEQSYSERQLYEAALDRLAREVSVVERYTETEAVKAIEAALAKGPRRGVKPAEGAEADDDGVVTEEAA
jgi:CarD family transcriptional regulator